MLFQRCPSGGGRAPPTVVSRSNTSLPTDDGPVRSYLTRSRAKPPSGSGIPGQREEVQQWGQDALLRKGLQYPPVDGVWGVVAHDLEQGAVQRHRERQDADPAAPSLLAEDGGKLQALPGLRVVHDHHLDAGLVVEEGQAGFHAAHQVHVLQPHGQEDRLHDGVVHGLGRDVQHLDVPLPQSVDLLQGREAGRGCWDGLWWVAERHAARPLPSGGPWLRHTLRSAGAQQEHAIMGHTRRQCAPHAEASFADASLSARAPWGSLARVIVSEGSARVPLVG
mmetsp:Transcript_64678/g.107191  ORF Transcript_64678/g.107191 Transcript_64678/m.107191 type:complete len:279 (+) Transcript_64678:187-1023(+)